MVLRADHAHLQGHFQYRARIEIVEVQDDVDDLSSDGVGEHTAISVMRELPNDNIGLIDAGIVE